MEEYKKAGEGERYFFTHYFLSDYCLHDAKSFFYDMIEADSKTPGWAKERLKARWEAYKMGRPEKKIKMDIDAVELHPLKGNGVTAVIITFPPEKALLEAAAVIAIRTGEDTARYFTWEMGIDQETNEPLRFVCEWTKAGMHKNHEQLRGTDIREFFRTVIAIITKKDTANQSKV